VSDSSGSGPIHETEIGPYLDDAGRLQVYPSRRARQIKVLQYLADKFEPGRRYSEREVNELLDRHHTFGDCALLRRDLVDSRLLERTRDGTQYWRPPTG
jgi:hypothetical protein